MRLSRLDGVTRCGSFENKFNSKSHSQFPEKKMRIKGKKKDKERKMWMVGKSCKGEDRLSKEKQALVLYPLPRNLQKYDFIIVSNCY